MLPLIATNVRTQLRSSSVRRLPPNTANRVAVFAGSHIRYNRRQNQTVLVVKEADLSHVMRYWHFSSSVNLFFKCACAAIQWSYLSDGLVGPFVYFHTSCVQRAFAGRLCDKSFFTLMQLPKKRIYFLKAET